MSIGIRSTDPVFTWYLDCKICSTSLYTALVVKKQVIKAELKSRSSSGAESEVMKQDLQKVQHVYLCSVYCSSIFSRQ